MSDNEHSDGLDDLQDLMNEYKDKDTETENNEDEVKPKIEKTDEFEVPMEKVIFGDKSSLLKNMAKAVKNEDDDEAETEQSNKKRKAEKRKPVWADEDDEDIHVGDLIVNKKRINKDHLRKDKSYKDHLAKNFERVVGAQPNWAKLERKERRADVDSDDEELLRTVGFLEKPTGSVLLPNNLDYKNLKPLNRATEKSEGAIVSVQFHPTSTAALVAGENGIVTIYGVDGRTNDKLHSIHLKNYPLQCVRIAPCGTKAFFGSFKSYYYSYDLMTATETRFTLPREVGSLARFTLSPCGRYMATAGRDGELHLFDANANELIHTFKQENPVADLRFTGDSKRIICSSKGPNASIFSLKMRRIEHSFLDEGCVNGHVIDLSPNQRLLATGTLEGVVNVYDFENVLITKTPTPVKSFLNLTTGISDVKFNHSSELLAMCSREVTNAVRIAHFPSGIVFSNFPGRRPDLGAIRTVEFSPGSGFFAMGTRNKTVHLYRLKHFNNY